jgi:drug/metabolite transporter (DMT)-like permease
MILSPNARGILCMLMAGFAFVSCDSFLKLLLRDMPPLQTLAMRGVFATLWCAVLVFFLGMAKEALRAFSFWNILRSLTEVIAVMAFIFALAHAPLADVTAIYQIAPLLVLAGSSFLYGEQVGLMRWALIGLGMLGALLVAQPGTLQSSPYLLLAFVTALASAARDLITRKVPESLPGPAVTFTVVLIVFLATALASILFENQAPLQPAHYAYAAASGFFVMIGHLCVFLAFRLATARAVAPFYYGLTFCAVTFGAAFFKEYPNALSVFGIGLIVACGLGVLIMERKGANT